MSEPSITDRDTIEQLADSFVARFRRGERPSVEEYAHRYPELAEELREQLVEMQANVEEKLDRQHSE